MEVDTLPIETIQTPPTRAGSRIKRRSTRLCDIGEIPENKNLTPVQTPVLRSGGTKKSATLTPQTPKSSILVRVDYVDSKTPTATENENDQLVVSESKKRGRPRRNQVPSRGTRGDNETATPAREGQSSNDSVSETEEDQRIKKVSSEEFSEPVDFLTPVRRGRLQRKKKCIEDELQILSTPPAETPEETPEDVEVTPTPSRKGRKRKVLIDGEGTAPKRVMKIIVCGVCQKEVPESNFHYHRYSAHQGLARAQGESQEFTEAEKKRELKKAIARMKKISCPKCGSSFTTVPGYQYHSVRCGIPAEKSVEKELHECTVCGKKVQILKAHMKIHEREAAREEMEKEAEKQSMSAFTPKSKRVAALKAATLLSEVTDDLTDANAKSSRKAEGLFVEPSSVKVTNSIIGAWKRQMSKEAKANCRYPTCSFQSESLNELKEHHVTCEVGLKLKTFACTKCDFRCPERSTIIEHVINTHVTEEDGTFELDSAESGEEFDDDGDLDDDEEEADGGNSPRTRPTRTPRRPPATGGVESPATPGGGRVLQKIYGFSVSDLKRFKTHPTSPLIPKWLAQFHKKNFSWATPLYSQFQPSVQREGQVTGGYLPDWKESVPVARRKVTLHNLHSPASGLTFERLQRFQGKILAGTPMFFCGGLIVSAAWCPMPFQLPNVGEEANRHQYLALCVLKDEHRFRGASESPFSSDYIIQLWNCGPLRNKEAAVFTPRLECCLAQPFGRIWALEWCPSGCYDDKRLGVLASACSDGTVRLTSVPRPTALQDSSESAPLQFIDPSLTLRLNIKEQSECTCLHWDSTRGHKHIVAGFASGVIAVWDLQTQSPLLKSDDSIIYPLWSFFAHSSIVTAVSLSPHHSNARFIASGSVDRTLKLWDRFDPKVPITCSKRARITQIRWRKHWPGVLVAVEDVFALFRTSTTFYDFGYTNFKHPLLPHNSVVWCTAENEYLDVISHCTAAGEVVVYSSHMAVVEPDDKKLRRTRSLVFRTDLIDRNIAVNKGDEREPGDEESSYLNHMKKVYMTPQNTKKPVRPKETQQKKEKNYALVFNDITTIRSVGKQAPPPKSIVSEVMDIALPDDEPLPSIKKIMYNPNFECHLWMCLCGENGIVQLLRFDSVVTEKSEEIYKQELKKPDTT